ncbi:MAG: DUF3334 family protein [Thermodesulfobacteria bacterium]|nr:DUF3334 family protein [Thermodesulfobacteriota bacterium]
MQQHSLKTVDKVAKIFCSAVKEVIDASTGMSVSYAPTIQDVPSISLKPDLGCFVQFNGDYSGLFIMNFSKEASLEIYKKAMAYMGLPDEEISNDFESDEVVNYVGEIINQVIGKARQKIETKYGLSANNNQPKAITISSAITLSVATMLDGHDCRKIAFRTDDSNPFYVEMNLEKTEFICLEPKEAGESADIQEHIDDVLEKGISGKEKAEAAPEADVEDIMAELGLD